MGRTIRFALLLVAIILVGIAGPLAWVTVERAAAGALPAIQAGRPAGSTFSVASLNIAKETRPEVIVEELSQHPTFRNADILLLQEVSKESDSDRGVAEKVAERLGRNVVFASPDSLPTTLGLAILSRYPIREPLVQRLRRCNLVFRTRSRIALSATVETPLGNIRIVDAHLDTRINPDLRMQQLEPVVTEAARFPGPAIVGGDFNTNDLMWFAAVLPVPAPGRQAGAIRSLMNSHGFVTPFGETGPTFDHFGMQLDWLYTNRLQAVSAAVQPLDFSDHHAIRVEYAAR